MKKVITMFIIIFGISSMLMAGERFIRDNTKEIVIDHQANLMWQDNNNTDQVIDKNWNEAIDYCENLTLGGYNNWHLPNRNELKSLVETNRYEPVTDPIFKNGTGAIYWSSSTYVDMPSYAWGISFTDGMNIGTLKTDTNYAIRCVRNN